MNTLKNFTQRNSSYGFQIEEGSNGLAMSNNTTTVSVDDGNIICYKDGPWNPIFQVPDKISYSLFEKLMFECFN